ncbi:hypothetical protein NPS29_12550 [Pseudomonas putida]|uniref:hypothetical protein n=1 Tax=Pseudomonas putida TaxID=303 RepID=UPI0023640883|nr:hypothetical protein [Pseudomonas putida]MDD1966151.1 hypothetical protein [Pseudomonas putida]
MTYEVIIEEFVLAVFITTIVDVKPSPGTWSSDWDHNGYRELEFEVWSGNTYDDDGVAIDLGANGCAAAAEQYAEEIEAELWRQIDAAKTGRWAA